MGSGLGGQGRGEELENGDEEQIETDSELSELFFFFFSSPNTAFLPPAPPYRHATFIC